MKRLAQTQAVIMELATNQHLREQFFANPQQTLLQLNIPEQEQQSLLQISREQLERFAVTLYHKRLGQVSALLPFTTQALSYNRLQQLFAEFAPVYRPRGHHKHQQDALAFSNYLLQNLRGRDNLPFYELVRYEKSSLQAFSQPRCLQLRLFRYPPQQLKKLATISPTSLRRKWSLVLWWRFSRRSFVRYWQIF